jgi:ubiquinone/menaquinone biosynthesis C-methylase UbiE
MHVSVDDGRFWDRAAQKYARSPIKDMAGYERTLDRTAQLLRGSDTVLELGCGTGTTALRLAPHVARIVATDISQGMIAIAREKASADGGHNVEFTAASTDRLSEVEGAFDAVLAFNLLHLLADRPSVLAHVHRLLKPGGHFVSKTPCLSEMNLLIRWAVPVMRVAGKAPYVSFFTAAELESDIAHAGFTVLERTRHGSQRKDPRIFILARKPASI